MGRTALAVAGLLVALPLGAQYPGQVTKASKDAPELRSIAVLEWTGEAGSPKASRLVPVAVLDGGRLQDGGIYLARPEPLALAGEVEYELQQNGKPVGLFEIKNAGQEQGSWVGYGAWKPLARPKPKPSMDEGSRRIEDEESDLPILHRKHHADESPAPGKNDRSTSGNSSEGSGTSAPAPAGDPDRPRLLRGNSSGKGLDVLPTLMGMPADMQQAVAVSDARSRPEHTWSYSWANEDDEARMKSALEGIARDALGLNPPPPLTPRKTGSRKNDKPAPPVEPPPPPPLIDEQFRVFQLANGAGATLVLTARTEAPLARQKFVTLIAQPDLYGNVLVLLKYVADGSRLDETPRMRLVDAVDALADNRGELLFELRGATQRQFSLYRVLRGQAEKLFANGGGEFGAESREKESENRSAGLSHYAPLDPRRIGPCNIKFWS
jgi:hypothetical protein